MIRKIVLVLSGIAGVCLLAYYALVIWTQSYLVCTDEKASKFFINGRLQPDTDSGCCAVMSGPIPKQIRIEFDSGESVSFRSKSVLGSDNSGRVTVSKDKVTPDSGIKITSIEYGSE